MLFDTYNQTSFDAPSDVANDIILAIKNTGFIDVCDIPANVRCRYHPNLSKKNPCLNDAKSNLLSYIYLHNIIITSF